MLISIIILSFHRLFWSYSIMVSASQESLASASCMHMYGLAVCQCRSSYHYVLLQTFSFLVSEITRK